MTLSERAPLCPFNAPPTHEVGGETSHLRLVQPPTARELFPELPDLAQAYINYGTTIADPELSLEERLHFRAARRDTLKAMTPAEKGALQSWGEIWHSEQQQVEPQAPLTIHASPVTLVKFG